VFSSLLEIHPLLFSFLTGQFGVSNDTSPCYMPHAGSVMPLARVVPHAFTICLMSMHPCDHIIPIVVLAIWMKDGWKDAREVIIFPSIASLACKR
jgi:hypothetical protein